MRLRWLALLAASTGCGVLSGLDNLSIGDGGGTDVTSSDGADDAAKDAGVDAALDVGACESGACGAPAGFQPVLFASDRGTLCPTGSTTLDVVVDPTAPANPCSCNCNYQPSCLPQPITYEYGFNACNIQQTLQGQVDGGCNGTSANLGTGIHLAAGPLPPANACTNTVKTNGKATTPPGRLCALADCSSCPSVSGFSICYGQGGDVACPQGMTKHSVGSDAQLTCEACTACTSTAKCKGTLQMYSDGQCATPIGALTVDGTCQGFNGNANIQSVKYVPNLDPGMCTPGTSNASIAFSAQTTVCCP